ncbi:MAG: PD40 domain-containing protein, partial [Sedimentisphaerales bacterium]|nr:PD40 domain-containing protein [Sedimentisphaerales bacterium]
MKRFNRGRMRLVFVGFVAAMVLGGGTTWADYVICDPMPAEDAINRNILHAQGCSFSHDGLELYFSLVRPGGYGDYDIWVVDRESPNAPWSEAVNLGPDINTGDIEGWPTISPDGLELYFWRGDYPMRSTRASKDDPWSPATAYTGVYPDDFSSDGLTKYTEANWSGGYGDYDIWVTTRETIDDPWSESVNLGSNINDSRNQRVPSISNDGLALFFITSPGWRIYMSVRATTEDEWGPALELGPEVNGYGWVNNPEISPDGSTLYFETGLREGFTERFWQVSIKPIVDFNGDGKVDGKDVLVMADRWATDDSLCDIGPMPWGDGIVDVEDLKVLAQYIGEPFDDPTLVAHYELDETEGMVASDSVGARDGIVHGEPIWQPEGGMIAGALQLNGIDDCIEIPLILDPAAGPFSVFAWVFGGAPGQVILCQNNGAKWLLVGENGVLATELSCPGATDLLASDVSITDGN